MRHTGDFHILNCSIGCISTSPQVTTSITQHLSRHPYSAISRSSASDTPMLTQNVNLPLGMFPIVIFTDLQVLSMDPLSNSMDFQNTPVSATILSLLPNTFS